MTMFGIQSKFGLENAGLQNLENVFWNYGPAELIEAAVHNHEGSLSNDGALMVNTGQFTGRSPKDKYIVDYQYDNVDKF